MNQKFDGMYEEMTTNYNLVQKVMEWIYIRNTSGTEISDKELFSELLNVAKSLVDTQHRFLLNYGDVRDVSALESNLEARLQTLENESRAFLESDLGGR